MHPEEPHRVIDDDGRMKPLRGECKEDDNEESWHDAREDGRETVSYAKAKNGTATEPEAEARGRAGEEEVGNGMSKDRSGRDSISDGTRSGRGSVGRNRAKT